MTPMDVYRDMFHLGEGLIQRENEPPGEHKANPLGMFSDNGKDFRYRILFEDTFEAVLAELQSHKTAFTNGISYFGRRNKSDHASKMYAMIFDLDGTDAKHLGNFFSGVFRAKAYPVPNYVILSGHGVHLYYIMERPIPLFPNIRVQLKNLKYALTERMWNPYTSTIKKPQIQGIFQPFRVIGGMTKEGVDFPKTRAFLISSHPTNIDELSHYVEAKYRVDEEKLFPESRMTLAEAKVKYPKWYEKVIVNGDKLPDKWDIAGKVHGKDPYALYHWWINKVKEGAAFHHRYFCVMALVIYGVKCDVPEEQIKEDATALVPFLRGLNRDDDFGEVEIDSALECYDDRYATFPIKDIEKLTAILIERNKRNGRKQSDHVEIMNFIRDKINKNTTWNKLGNGRKPKEAVVKEWRATHQEGRKADCIRETGLDKKTVYKWWGE